MKRLFFLGFGLVFWLVGVGLIRWLGPILFDGGWRHIAFFAIAFLITPPVMWIAATLSKTSRSEMVVPAVIMSMGAMLLDGLAVTGDALGITAIYAGTPRDSAYAGGLLLFAFWCLLATALFWHREPST